MERDTLQLILSAASAVCAAAAWHATLGGDVHRLDPDLDGRGRSEGSAW